MLSNLYFAKKILLHKRSFLINSLLIILVTVPLVCSLIFVDSMIEGITDKYICLSSGQIQLTGQLSNSNNTNQNNNTNNTNNSNNLNLTNYPSIISLDPVLSGYAVLYSETTTTDVMLKGVTSSYFNSKRLNQISITSGSNDLKGNEIMVSDSVAKRLNLKIGDKMALMVVTNPDSLAKGNFASVIRPVMVTLASTFNSGYSQLDDNMIFSSFDYARTIFKQNTINYEVLTTNNDATFNQNLAIDLINSFDCFDSFVLWSELNTSVFKNFVNSRQMVLIIFIVISIIACFYTGSIANELIQRNFSTLCTMKLLGSSDKAIKKTVFTAILFLTIISVIIGLILGILISYNLSPLLKSLANSSNSAFSMYLLDFVIVFEPLRVFGLCLLLIIVSSISVLLTLRNEKKLSPIMLLQS